MARRIPFWLIAVAVISLGLNGCFLNTPDRVVERFIAHLKGMRWGKMAELVDWPHSSQYVRGIPSSNEGEENRKKEVMLRIAENLTDFPVQRKTPDQIQHEFLYLRLHRLAHIKDGSDWAWLEADVCTEARRRTVQILVMKINRVWRIVLTDSILK